MINHILVPLDGSALAECVLPHTFAVAHAFGAQVTLLHVLEPTQMPGQPRAVDPVYWHIRKAEIDAYLDVTATRLHAAGLEAQYTVLEGQPAERVIEYARDNGVDLVILSSHGRSGLSGWNVSSVVQKIILRIYRPILLVRAYQLVTPAVTGLRYQRLLVPLDGSQRAECILPLASNLALAHEAQLLLTHVIHKPEMPRHAPLTQEEAELVTQLTERNRAAAVKYLEQLRARLPGDVETRLIAGVNVLVTLHELAEQEKVDLVVLNAHGYSGETRWPYGGTVTSFIAYGNTPLLIAQDVLPEAMGPTPAEAAAQTFGVR
ncbi:MAG TPA: universal stress protein [Anaerolineae bacterium]|nr:universal stress protein [Anaerolineae bacterium]